MQVVLRGVSSNHVGISERDTRCWMLDAGFVSKNHVVFGIEYLPAAGRFGIRVEYASEPNHS